MSIKANDKSTGSSIRIFAVSVLFLLFTTVPSAEAATKAVKDLQNQINTQQTQINTQQNQINVLNTLLDQSCLEGSVVTGISPNGIIECTDLTPWKTVFVTSQTYNGNLGGVSGADAKCQLLASGAGLSGTYKAWISTSTSSPSITFNQSNDPYVLVNGEVVAQNYLELITTKRLQTPINRDEDGLFVPATFVWTNTLEDGTAWEERQNSIHNCSDFESLEGSATTGLNSQDSLTQWSFLFAIQCDQSNGHPRLYCFEQ